MRPRPALLDRRAGADERAVHRRRGGIEHRGDLSGGEPQHVAKHEHGALAGREAMKRGEERERYRLAGLVAGLRTGRAVDDAFEQRVGIGLEPQHLAVAGGLRGGGCQPGRRRGASTAVAQHVQTAVGGDPIQPGAQRRALLERLQCSPRGEECLLHRVLGVLHLAEDPVAVQLQLAPVGVRERRERLMVARTGTDQSAVVHERSLASRLTTIVTPPMLEIRRRVSPPGGVRTRDRQIRVLIGRPMRTSRPPQTIDRAATWSALR